MKLDASADLLIGQWRNAPKFYTMVDKTIGIVQEDVSDTLEQLTRMWNVDEATGIWLDFLGVRVGIIRPLVEDPTMSRRFGFSGTQAWSFDLAPFRGVLDDQKYPLSDVIFRRFVKARGLLITTLGEFGAFERAVQFIDPDAKVEDHRDMSVTIQTDNRTDVELADTIGALPRPAGVRIIWEGGATFGFDGHGEPFDQARYD